MDDILSIFFGILRVHIVATMYEGASLDEYMRFWKNKTRRSRCLVKDTLVHVPHHDGSCTGDESIASVMKVVMAIVTP